LDVAGGGEAEFDGAGEVEEGFFGRGGLVLLFLEECGSPARGELGHEFVVVFLCLPEDAGSS